MELPFKPFGAFFATLCLSFLCATVAVAQSGQSVQWRYIENYKDMAIDQMQRYRIPASITLAQGLIESGAGQSRLAREAHNHFGIKVGMNWTGPYIVMADDRPDDRFRKYRTDDESYEDHSRFLRNNQRYRSLFSLSLTDYKGWAHGLKRCGYATNPRYPEMLIGTIERYNLQQFDSYTSGRYHARTYSAGDARSESDFFSQHIVYRVNKTYMIIANATDTWEKVARETGVSKRKLMKYNERLKNSPLATGDIVYLEKKRSKADKSLKGVPHVVQPGESLYDIAQHYAVRLKNIYTLNGLSPDYVPQAGDLIWLR
ncbi:MAG: glucosaminidase domain-containing protein [Bacteroidaceae bacterium]|nr:glucosaminidase domain-containing protein [Bacteroidaceae bacterium]